MSYLKVALGSAPSTCFDSARARVSLAETDFTDVGAVVLGMEDVAAGTIKDLAAKGLEIPVFVVTSEKDLLSSEVLKATTGVIELGKQSAVYYGREVETALTKYEASLYPPFFGMLKKYVEMGNSAFDCPGHQGGQFFRKHPAGRQFFEFFGENLFRSDLCNADVKLGDLLIHEGAPHDCCRALLRPVGFGAGK